MKNRRGLPSNEYWQERAEDRLDEAERLSVPYLEDIHAVYDDARLKIVEDIKNLYKNYYKDDEGFDQEKLRVIIPNGDLERFHLSMKKAGLSEYLPDNYKARMTRLEYLYADCWAESKKASLKHQQIETKAHRETIHNAYYKTIYDTGVGLKINPAFSKLDNRAVNQVLNTKFLGGNYSERIWKNTDKLANTLKEVIGSAIARGESYSKTARGVRERFGVTQYEATRLVQTETCYFQNQAEIEALKTMGIEKYKFIATLDSRTSDICREHDKKVYNIEDAKAGENLPPLHPNCRSTVSAYLGEEYESAIRVARNENGESEYVENIPYSEWLKRVENGTLRRESVDLALSSTTSNNIENTAIIKDEAFSSYARRLSMQNNEVAQKVSNIMYGKTESEVLSKLDVSEAVKYKKFLGNRVSGLIRLKINSGTIRHLYKRGHFTGKALIGKDDKSPLKISDWKKLDEVFKNPDTVILSYGNIQIDKWFGKKHLRLIVTKSKSMKKTSMITFFDRVGRKKE